MQALHEQILPVVVLEFLFIGHVPVAGVEALWKKKQAAEAVAVFSEVGRMAKLVFVPFWVVGPNVLHLVAVLTPALDVFGVD